MSAQQFDLPFVLSILALVGVAGGWVANHYRSVIGQNAKIHEIEIAVGDVRTRFDIFWKVIEQELPKILVRPTHKEMDELLYKLAENKISDEEIQKLKEMMREELDQGISKEDSGRALSYVIMLARLESKRAHVSNPGVG